MNLLALLALGVLMQPQPYTTMDAAAMAGLSQSFKLSGDYEYGGTVYERRSDHAFFISTPASQFDAVSVRVSTPDKVIVPNETYDTVATFHTHPCKPEYADMAQYFSPQDQLTSAKNNIYGYMADTCTGNVHKLAPDAPIGNLVPPAPTPAPEDSSALLINSTFLANQHVMRKHMLKIKLPGDRKGLTSLVIGYSDAELRRRAKDESDPDRLTYALVLEIERLQRKLKERNQ